MALAEKTKQEIAQVVEEQAKHLFNGAEAAAKRVASGTESLPLPKHGYAQEQDYAQAHAYAQAGLKEIQNIAERKAYAQFIQYLLDQGAQTESNERQNVFYDTGLMLMRQRLRDTNTMSDENKVAVEKLINDFEKYVQLPNINDARKEKIATLNGDTTRGNVLTGSAIVVAVACVIGIVFFPLTAAATIGLLALASVALIVTVVGFIKDLHNQPKADQTITLLQREIKAAESHMPGLKDAMTKQIGESLAKSAKQQADTVSHSKDAHPMYGQVGEATAKYPTLQSQLDKQYHKAQAAPLSGTGKAQAAPLSGTGKAQAAPLSGTGTAPTASSSAPNDNTLNPHHHGLGHKDHE